MCVHLWFNKLLWLQVLVPASYQSVPPLCVFIVLLLASPTRMSHCTCPLGVFPTTNARLFSLPRFLVCYQLELLILTVCVQLGTDKKPNQTKKQNPQELLVVLEVFSLSETEQGNCRKIMESENSLSCLLLSLNHATFFSLLRLVISEASSHIPPGRRTWGGATSTGEHLLCIRSCEKVALKTHVSCS